MAMGINFKKKIKGTKAALILFVKENFAQLFIICGVFVILQITRGLPYINLIPHYQELIVGLCLFLTIVLLPIFSSTKNLSWLILSFFVIGALTEMFGAKEISELIGFIVFILLAISLRYIFKERKSLKQAVEG